MSAIEPRSTRRDGSRNNISRCQFSIGMMFEEEPATLRINNVCPGAS
jgi:hypothetical protein